VDCFRSIDPDTPVSTNESHHFRSKREKAFNQERYLEYDFQDISALGPNRLTLHP
jgi:hypothetical protein